MTATPTERYRDLIALLSAGTRLPADLVDSICAAADVGPGRLSRDLVAGIGVAPRCGCGGKMKVYSVHRAPSGRRIQYTRCPACKNHGKVVAMK